jgi:hypothetical protein
VIRGILDLRGRRGIQVLRAIPDRVFRGILGLAVPLVIRERRVIRARKGTLALAHRAILGPPEVKAILELRVTLELVPKGTPEHLAVKATPELKVTLVPKATQGPPVIREPKVTLV